MPNLSFSCWRMCDSSALRSSALDGMHPTLRQTPPQYLDSTTAALRPSCEARIAATYPPGPAPRTTTSKSAMGGSLLSAPTWSHLGRDDRGSAYGDGRVRSTSWISRAAGAAVVAPVPPWATTTATAYRGWFAGAYETNHEVSCAPNTSAVPVLPATGHWRSGNPRNASFAVPSSTTPCR